MERKKYCCKEAKPLLFIVWTQREPLYPIAPYLCLGLSFQIILPWSNTLTSRHSPAQEQQGWPWLAAIKWELRFLRALKVAASIWPRQFAKDTPLDVLLQKKVRECLSLPSCRLLLFRSVLPLIECKEMKCLATPLSA